ncbi:MAG: MinD/ParA family protein [Gammaproteobacteria bacterium]|nr:MinD/ParA family protein [Gammaproteobacteria bacterium]
MSKAPINQPASILTIASGKGGVGKTNVASSLGLALAQAGKRVILLDMDLGLANLDVVLGVRAEYNLSHVIKGEKTITQALSRGPGGLVFVSGGPGDEEMANLSQRVLNRLCESMQELAWLADYLIIDTSAGLSRNTISFTRAADEVLVVTTPEPTAMVDAYALIKTILQGMPEQQLRLLVNMARGEADAVQIIKRLSMVVKSFSGHNLKHAGYLPYDNAVGLGVRKRKSFYLEAPYAPASVAIRKFSQKILADAKRASQQKKPQQSQQDFLQRLLNAFKFGN